MWNRYSSIHFPLDLDNPSAGCIRKASYVIQTKDNPVEVALLYEQLETNITFWNITMNFSLSAFNSEWSQRVCG